MEHLKCKKKGSQMQTHCKPTLSDPATFDRARIIGCNGDSGVRNQENPSLRPATQLIPRRKRFLYYLVQRGQIPAIQIGGRWRIKKSSLDGHVLGMKTRKCEA